MRTHRTALDVVVIGMTKTSARELERYMYRRIGAIHARNLPCVGHVLMCQPFTR